jgi:PAS domain S-box-containing protein
MNFFKSILWRKSCLGIIFLILAAYLGNYFKLTLFFGVDFLFGTIAVLLTLSIYGLFWGTVAAIISSSYTYLLWGHPYAMVVLICEVLFVGLLLRRKNQNLLLLDGIYWVFIGSTLVAIFYYNILHVQLLPLFLVIIKQAANGLFNALIASLMLNYLPIATWMKGYRIKHKISLQQTLFNLFIAFALFPVMAITITDARRVVNNVETEIVNSLNALSNSLSHDIETWKKNTALPLQQIDNIFIDNSNNLELINSTIKNIHNTFGYKHIYVTNNLGQIVANYPQISHTVNLTQFANIQPQENPVYILGTPENYHYDGTIFMIGIPIMDGDEFLGRIIGEIDTKNINDLINKLEDKNNFRIDIIDQENRIIATNSQQDKIFQKFNRDQAIEKRKLNSEIEQWLPISPGTPIMTRWEKSFYVKRTLLDRDIPLHLIIAAPTKAKVKYLQIVYLKNLATMLITAILALMVVNIISDRLVKPIDKLTRLTTDLPQKIWGQEEINLSNSKISEINDLTHNFKSMVVALHQMFKEIKSAKENLEERVDQRTKELSITNTELGAEIVRRKQVEKILREREERYELAISGTNDGIWDWNVITNEVYYSPTWMRILGYDQETLPQNMSTWLDNIHPDDQEPIWLQVNQHLEGKTQLYQTTYRMKHRQGYYIWVAAKGKCLRDDQGQPYRFVGIITDITDKKIAEEELKSAKEAAEIANITKSEFLATMSHEIRTPMNAVIGMTGLLLDTKLTSLQREFVEIIRNSGDAMLTLINDILDFSKIESGKLEIDQQIFNLRNCVEECLDLVAPLANDKELELAYLMNPEIEELIRGDVTRVRQILVNLLSNAIKFTHDGEIVVTVSSRPLAYSPESHVILDASEQSYEILFSVKDTGIGIPSDKQHRLFQPFSQVDASTTRQYGGTGLGLVISQKLTEMMGGKMWFESQQGEGSTFFFTIVVGLGNHSSLINTNSDWQYLVNKRLLIANQQIIHQQALIQQSQSLGMNPIVAASDQEAIALLEQQDFDVAIVDMQTLDVHGSNLVLEIQKLTKYQQLPLLVLTSIGDGQSNKMPPSSDFDVAGYLNKPIKKTNLANILLGVFSSQLQPVNTFTHALNQLNGHMAEMIPLKILIAEDNVVNQKVALHMLQRLGYRADIVANGLEVLTALRRQSYDVVLMDIQMPEMDGLTATIKICQEWPSSHRPWIVAMTANAMQGDQEKCLAVGMNDYIAKPIRMEDLSRALDNCYRHIFQQNTVNISTDKMPQTPTINNVLDQSILQELREIICDNQIEEFIQIINSYLEDASQRLISLNIAIAENNAKQLQLEAHALKSSSNIVGATNLSKIFKELEFLGRIGNTTDAEPLLNQAITDYQQVEAELKLIITNK